MSFKDQGLIRTTPAGRLAQHGKTSDVDHDGDQDLYVANDFGRNNLYLNETPPRGKIRFRDIAAEKQVEDISPGMSANWGDVNNDGNPDLYVSNMFSGAGNRITFQKQFKPGESSLIRERFQRASRGNTLFLNTSPDKNDSLEFDDISEGAGITVGRWAWNSKLADINNDGLQDILVANGFMTQADTGDL